MYLLLVKGWTASLDNFLFFDLSSIRFIFLQLAQLMPSLHWMMWQCLENTLKRTLSFCLYSPLTWVDIEALVVSLMSTPEHSAELSTNSKILWTLSPKARFSKPSRSIIFVKEYSHPWDEMEYLRPDEDEICSITTSVDPRWFLNDHDSRRTKDSLLFPQTVLHPSLNLRPLTFSMKWLNVSGGDAIISLILRFW